MKRAALLLALVLAGCGSNAPDPPPPMADVTGTWAGTYNVPQLGGSGTASLGLVQSGPNVTGTWSTSGGSAGTISGTNATRGRSGSFTAALAPSDPRTCGFQATLNFNLDTGRMDGQIVTTSCTVTASGTVTLAKR